jgi:Tfp pilus assembly protein PilO
MSARDKKIVGAVVLVLIAVLGYVALIEPQHSRASAVRSQTASVRSKLARAESQVAAGVATEGQYRVLAGQLRSINTAVPGDAQIPQLIEELQGASTASHVRFETVAVSGSAATAAATSTTATTGSLPSQSYSLTFTGNYFAVTGLLGRLAAFTRIDNTHFQATGRLITIGTLSLSPGGSGSPAGSAGSGAVTAQVTADDYDVPTALVPLSATGASLTTTAGAVTRAADVTP